MTYKKFDVYYFLVGQTKGLRMKYQRRYQAKFGCVITFALALFIAGCGGGGSTSGGASPSANVQTLNADAGNIIGIRVGDTANLDGSASTAPASGSLTYAWSFTHKPQTSKIDDLINANTANPSFVPDVIGSYMVQLIVTSNGISSKRAIALVEASISGNLTGDVRVHTSFSSRCSNCHDGRYIDANVNPGVIPPKSGVHVGTSNVCEACHTTFGFNLSRFTDHTEVLGNCSSCHNGVDATGKSARHIQTTGECNDSGCHNTTSFLNLDANGNYDHTGITSGCASCHDGKIAIGINHNPDTFEKSNTDCVFCHNTTTFTKPFPNHDVILADVTASTDRCDRCHGVDASGPIADHPDVKIPDPDVDCIECHTINQFSLGGVFNHRIDASVMSCESCHTDPNSINATTQTHSSFAPKDCGVCHGVGGDSFASPNFDHSTLSTERCDSCHRNTAPNQTPKLAMHILTQTVDPVAPSTDFTGVDCVDCHTPGNFKAGTFDHSLTHTTGPAGTLVCSDCHNNTNSVGKIANHIPTALECDSCHTADTPASPSTFTGTLFHYNPVSENFPNTGCNDCHNGVIQTGQNITHLTTVRDCSNCHTISNTVALTFAGATYDHGDPGISTNCVSCHDGLTAIDKTAKVNHLPSNNECSECHTDTTVPGGFATNIFLANAHPNYINGCQGCHSTKYLSAQTDLLKAGSVNHLPTSQDCHFCHTNLQFATEDPAIFTHAGITGNCESCHDGNYFASANAMGKAHVPDPINNPHPVTTADCGLCHGIGNDFADGIFDHTGIVDNCSSCHGETSPPPPDGAVTRKSSMTNPSHVTTTQDCSICHIPGTFKTAVFNHDQIVDNCGVSCHGGGTPTATIKPLTGHVPTNAKDCVECHNTTAFAGAKFDHNGIVGRCTTCHDGIIALGKDGKHVPTSDDCSACHQTSGMIPATFDHGGIVNNCVSCHDGVFATSKNTGHVSTTFDCGSCHSIPSTVIVANGPTNGWIPASFNHSGVSNNTRCDSCHGVTATPMSTDHWVTSFDCRDCHTTITFLGGTWKHDGAAANNCDSCHNDTNPAPNGGATAIPNNGHINTNLQCDSCHITTRWSPTNFTHDSGDPFQARHPGVHKRATNCVDCHGNSVVRPFVYRFSYTPVNACAACHENKFKPKDKHNGGENGTVEQNKDCAESGCHKVDDGGW